MSPGGVTTDQWLEAAKYRRTVYGIKGTSAVSDSRIEEIIKKVLDFAPSSFNTQPMRITYLTGEKHKQFWDIIINLVGPMLKSMNEAAYDTMSGVMNGHKAAYGSVRPYVRRCIPLLAACRNVLRIHELNCSY